MRPIYLRLEERTKAHALVVMLAYRIIQHLQHCWRDFNLTVEEGVTLLSSHCLMDVLISNKTIYSEVPIPRDDLEKLFSAADVSLPSSISYSGVTVSTKKKLQNERVS